MKRGGAVLDRALRAARKYAAGGQLDETGLGRPARHVPHLSGMLNSSIPGRTDKLPMSVAAGSYVVPSDVGEYVVEPEVVTAIGGGDLSGGHDELDRFVKEIRKGTIRTLRHLPEPKAD